ncbi:SAM-dependent methyltransferase [Merismopedia glauca CCAP 1448/3]|uniref:SAM-dependent methyltransferase n=2 Tax=Merismopedia TaxID=53402 RepID=A0A2T1C2W1_9CYAN|nr:SAM-dependent methyltransferase [Merismopedia glauca CCAP 1448/3]
MSNSEYIFTSTQHSQELERLQALEQVFDPATRKKIESTGISAGWRCLEVGAGAGAIAQWMATVVGDNGSVVAVDLNTRFLNNLRSPNLEVIEADIRYLPLNYPLFDLVHARYVLIHIPDFQVALSRMLDLLKPGGWIVIEEPDFSVARAIYGEKDALESFNRVYEAICQMFAQLNLDYAFGIKLPAIFQQCGLQQLSVENDVPLSNGGSGIAKVMKMSTVQLAEKYISTSVVDSTDIDRYCQFADDPQTWAIYYGTVGVIARKGHL